MEKGVPVPYTPTGPWSPPGISTPWPKDEYVRDGGHLGPPVTAGSRVEIRGLQMEDTVARFETPDGQTRVQPSNPVYLYSPRFSAVRQVVNLEDQVQIERSASVHEPVKLVAPTVEQIVVARQQDLQIGDNIGAVPAAGFRTKLGSGAVSAALGPLGFQDRFKPYENLSVIRQGILAKSETAWLIRASDAALAWSHTQSVQVMLERRAAMVESGSTKVGSVYTLGPGAGQPAAAHRQGRFHGRSPSRATRSISPSASTTSATRPSTTSPFSTA